MGVSAQKPAFSDVEQPCIRKTRKPPCAAQNELHSAARKGIIRFEDSVPCGVQSFSGVLPALQG